MDFTTFRRKVGLRLKELRLERELSQEDLDTGDDGIPYRTIQNIESGRSSINLRTIYKISKKLKIDPRELFSLEKVTIQPAKKRPRKKSLYKSKKEN
ncbi:helix-turn-helix transcriptional regulator [Leptospira interrogans]|uniref:helix-turn-helix transcriptional regulator n=1 Tax=Leptospira interrogans TaxID=173 RepID=UPI0002B92306|nr:helix-turn-helix transcriptional regulator [Leptospira interrogans]MCR8649133.1 transcriptional regulator [Leptospira interrogans serovar Bataviae]OAM86097.1 transcriptional regulator [Leptospira interrogans serovar Bataviae]QOI40455.1 helix-turn-helix transcriptional regulator [Leptospira interrogans serovar Bataviae]